MPTLGPGAGGDEVRDIQSRLSALSYRIDPEEYGRFEHSTDRAVREFQQQRGLIVDGLVGADTWEELVEAGYGPGDRLLYLRHPFYRGDDVRSLQTRLNLLGFDAGKEDGIFGQRTDRAVREFQRNVGVRDDGIVGHSTLEALRRLRPVGPGPGRATVREGEALRRLSASIQGARIAVDAGHGPGDPGATGSGGSVEADVAEHLAVALSAELERRGANPVVLRPGEADPSVRDRATAANGSGAEVLISMHLNSHSDPSAEGCSSYYYGTGQWQSQAGQRLAELIQDEVTNRLGLRDCRAHPKAIQLLRETRMPAVQVEPCYITNPREERLLEMSSFREAVAEAVVEALERFFSGRGEAAPGPPRGGLRDAALTSLPEIDALRPARGGGRGRAPG